MTIQITTTAATIIQELSERVETAKVLFVCGPRVANKRIQVRFDILSDSASIADEPHLIDVTEHFEKIIQLTADLLAMLAQKELDPELEKILKDNLWDLME